MSATPLDRVDSLLSSVETVSSVVANVAMLLMMAIIAAGTFARYVLNDPIVGSNTVVELYLMPLLVFGTVALLQRERGNINVDLLRRRFGEGHDQFVSLVTHLGVFAVFVPITWLTYGQAIQRLSRGATMSIGMQLPTGYSWLIVSIGSALLCVRVLVEAAKNLTAIVADVRGDRPPSGDE